MKKLSKLTYDDLIELIHDEIIYYYDEEREGILQIKEEILGYLEKIIWIQKMIDEDKKYIDDKLDRLMDTVQRHAIGVQNVYDEFIQLKEKIR